MFLASPGPSIMKTGLYPTSLVLFDVAPESSKEWRIRSPQYKQQFTPKTSISCLSWLVWFYLTVSKKAEKKNILPLSKCSYKILPHGYKGADLFCGFIWQHLLKTKELVELQGIILIAVCSQRSLFSAIWINIWILQNCSRSTFREAQESATSQEWAVSQQQLGMNLQV